MADPTYSIDTPNPVQQSVAPATQASPDQTQAMNGPVAQGNQVQVPDTSAAQGTITALLKLGSDVLAPKIKEAAQAQFMQGVQQAATGEAVKDIVNEQPAWTQIFGPSSAVQGARAYTSATQIAQFGGDMAAQMPALAQQGPEALTAAMQASLKSHMTGDPATDAAITSAYAEQMAPLYKQQATQHAVYVQKQASEAQQQSWLAQSKVFQQNYEDSKNPQSGVSPDDAKASFQRMLGAMVPFAGQPDESYEKNVTQFAMLAAKDGNFAVLNGLQQNGLIAKLPIAYQEQVEQAMKLGGGKALDAAYVKYPQLAVEKAQIMHDGTQNPLALPGMIQAFNQKAADLTGVPITSAQMIPNGSVDNVVASDMLTQRAQAEKAATAQQKIDEKNRNIVQAGQMFSPAAPGQQSPIQAALKAGVVKKEDADSALMAGWGQMSADQQAQTLLAAKGPEKFAAPEIQIARSMGGDQYSPGFQATADLFSKLQAADQIAGDSKSGEAGKYFNEDQVNFISMYNQKVAGGEDPAAAYAITRNTIMPAKSFLDPSEKNAMDTQIRKYVENNNEHWWGWNTIDDASMSVAQAVTGQSVKQLRTTQDIPSAVAMAMNNATSTGRLQILGKHAIVGEPGQTPIPTILGNTGTDRIGANATADAFEDVMSEKAKAIGADLKDYTVVRVADGGTKAAPVAQMYVEAVDPKSGALHSFYVTSDDIRKQPARATAQATGPSATAIHAVGAGASTMMGAGPGALSIPSPYAN